ncbi:hypothetical protein F4782DRAFT_516578 [Xylaria castorea]|nr:hypothetical protein F4782DRAFT_516578 [Xylaria castorea]
MKNVSQKRAIILVCFQSSMPLRAICTTNSLDPCFKASRNVFLLSKRQTYRINRLGDILKGAWSILKLMSLKS